MDNKIIVILGPTATGKTNLAVKVAEKYNAEIISADSRQIYKKLDIGTGKDLHEYNINNKKISYHLIDILDSNENYSVYNFQKDFEKAYSNIIHRNKNVIICGGTGLYIESLLLDYNLINSPPPDINLRNKLENKSLSELIEYFEKINHKIIVNPKLDTKNRVIRNIEICLNKTTTRKYEGVLPINNYTVIGINPGREIVRKKITKRLRDRFNNGLLNEVQSLIKDGLTYERLFYLGLEYRLISQHLKGEFNQKELFEKLNSSIHRFAKKQMTFFRRMEKRNIKINWVENNNLNQIKDLL